MSVPIEIQIGKRDLNLLLDALVDGASWQEAKFCLTYNMSADVGNRIRSRIHRYRALGVKLIEKGADHAIRQAKTVSKQR